MLLAAERSSPELSLRCSRLHVRIRTVSPRGGEPGQTRVWSYGSPRGLDSAPVQMQAEICHHARSSNTAREVTISSYNSACGARKQSALEGWVGSAEVMVDL
ncbi:unnamed protein product [Pleuronectes platessa]|uniref:Uncharacterized protein n=1 Tax=Pleuronectes platessa TaxID=8262 RepID=A0A9N7VAV0_PLEPL|nr:unnamed protein product [Pleuronectes platessa]